MYVLIYLLVLIVGTACIQRRAGIMQLTSVCLSICPITEEQLSHSQAAGNQAAVTWGCSMAPSSKCGQCHVYSKETRLNRTLFICG